jgi:hypothetical protein
MELAVLSAMLGAALVASKRLAGFTWLLEITAALSEMAPWQPLASCPFL